MTARALSSLPSVVHPQQPYPITQPPVNWSGINHARMTADMETLPGNPLRALMRLRRLVGDHCTIRIDRGVRGLAAFFDQSQGWIKQNLLLLQERGYIHLSYPADGVTAITVLPPSVLQASVISFPSPPAQRPRRSTSPRTKPVQRTNGPSAHQDAENSLSGLYQSGTTQNVDCAHPDTDYSVSDLYQSGTTQNTDRTHQDTDYDAFGCIKPVHTPTRAQHSDAGSDAPSQAISHPDAQNRLISDADQTVSKWHKTALLCTDPVQTAHAVSADCNAHYEDHQHAVCTEAIQPIYLESYKQQHGSMQRQTVLAHNEQPHNEQPHNEQPHNEQLANSLGQNKHISNTHAEQMQQPEQRDQLRAALLALQADPTAIEHALAGRPNGTLAEWQQDLSAAEQRPDVHSPLGMALAAWSRGQRVTAQRSSERSERPRYQPRPSRYSSGAPRSWSQRDECPIDTRRAIADWGFVSGDDVSDLGGSFSSFDGDQNEDMPSFEPSFVPRLPTLEEAQARWDQRQTQRSR
jgi:hypothetical protein